MVVSKPQWQSKTYRVTFFSGVVHASDVVKQGELEILKKIGDDFAATEIYHWVEENQIQLGYINSDNQISWHRYITFYGDLTEEQYTDYILRFAGEIELI